LGNEDLWWRGLTLQECILEILASKTVVYVTHQMEFLPAADLILVGFLVALFPEKLCFIQLILLCLFLCGVVGIDLFHINYLP
jgi:hypothetical protein